MGTVLSNRSTKRSSQGGQIKETPAYVRFIRRHKLDKLFYTMLTIVVIAIWAYPVLLTVINAFKTNASVMLGPLSLPIPPTLQAFIDSWGLLDFPTWMKNSAFLALGGTALAILLAAPPAYILSRFRLLGGEAFFMLLLIGMVLPQQAIILPLYDIMRKLKILDSLWGLVLIHGVYGMSFTMLFLRGFMVNIPVDLEDAARVDGASDVQLLRHVILPLAAPGVAIAAALNIISIWNELFFALVLLESPEKFPITMGLQLMTTSRYFMTWNMPAAAVIIAQIPTILLYTFAYRYIQKGLLTGGIKG